MDFGDQTVSVREALTNLRNHEFGLEVVYQRWDQRMDSSTHLKDMKDSIEVRPPGGNRGFIPLRVENTRDRISFFRLCHTPLDLCHGPAIEGVVSELRTAGISDWC